MLQKQYCNVRTEICCRIEIVGVTSQAAVGVGSTLNQGSYAGQSSFGSKVGLGATGTTSFAKGTYGAGSTAFGSNVGTLNKGVVGFTPAVVPSTPKFTATNAFKGTGQTNFIETDSFAAGSVNSGVYRPGAIGSNLKPGIPYLPPVDNPKSGSNIVSSTIFPTPTFVTTPKPITKATYLPPPITSTAAPGYLPPFGEQTINRETIVPNPNYSEGSLILDQNRQPTPVPVPVPSK